MFEYSIERDHPFRSPKERLMSCDSPIAICGMNATCGIFIRICAIFSFITLLPLIILIPCVTSASSVSSLCLITLFSGSTNAYHCFGRRIAMDGRAMAEMIGSIANFGSAIDSPMMLCPWPHHYGKEMEGVKGVVATLKGILMDLRIKKLKYHSAIFLCV